MKSLESQQNSSDLTLDGQTKRRLIHRIRIIQGHMRGVERMYINHLNFNDPCISDVILQTKAVRKSLVSFDKTIVRHACGRYSSLEDKINFMGRIAIN